MHVVEIRCRLELYFLVAFTHFRASSIVCRIRSVSNRPASCPAPGFTDGAPAPPAVSGSVSGLRETLAEQDPLIPSPIPAMPSQAGPSPLPSGPGQDGGLLPTIPDEDAEVQALSTCPDLIVKLEDDHPTAMADLQEATTESEDPTAPVVTRFRKHSDWQKRLRRPSFCRSMSSTNWQSRPASGDSPAWESDGLKVDNFIQR